MNHANALLTMLLMSAPITAMANEPITPRGAWEGRVDYFVTGTVLAVDTDGDFRVDTSAQPAGIAVRAADAPGTLEAAWLYWGGSQVEPLGAPCTTGADDTVTLGLPGGSAITVTADDCYCSDGGSTTYDVWTCRTDVTTATRAAGGQITGTWTVDGYDGLYLNGSTHNASAALFLVYSDNALPPRRVAAFDGNIDLANTQQVISLAGIEVDSIPSGELAYYVLEGDISGGGVEAVSVQGLPGGTPIVLSDAVNPVGNPFNQTINTTTPPQTGLVGVDIDSFDITPALAAMDTQVNVTVSAGDDKVWLAAAFIGVDLFDPAFSRNSTKSVAIFVDQNGDGFANPGDTLRYTIRLENDGNEAGTVNLRDSVPAEFVSYTVVDAAGGIDSSNAAEVRIDGISVPAGSSRSVIIDMVVGEVPDGIAVINTATWSSPLQGGLSGQVSSVATEIKNPVAVDPDMGNGDPDMGNVDPDMGGPDPDMGAPDMGANTDMGTSSPDMSTSDMATRGDAGETGPDGGPLEADSGATPDDDSGFGPGSKTKNLSDSGCCATAQQSPLSGAWALAVLVLVSIRRRRSR